jgi:hypothetical protein
MSSRRILAEQVENETMGLNGVATLRGVSTRSENERMLDPGTAHS